MNRENNSEYILQKGQTLSGVVGGLINDEKYNIWYE